MAWTAPRTWTTGELVTASMLNTHVRDNLLETAPAKVTTAGDVVYATAANALARLGIGAATTVLHGGASAPAWSAVATGDIANDAVDDTKAGNRVLRLDRRQGGSATAWNANGTTDYTPTTVRAQTGSVAWSGGAATSGTVAVTFPVAFSDVPLVFVNGTATIEAGYASSITASGANMNWFTTDGASTKIAVVMYWLAVGPE